MFAWISVRTLDSTAYSWRRFVDKQVKVYSFEPDPYARQNLEKNLNLNPSLKRPIVESLACSDQAGQTVLFSKGGQRPVLTRQVRRRV